MAVAAIGNLKLWGRCEGDRRLQLEPTILTLPNQPAQAAVLTASLGIGFNPGKIQARTIKLGAGDFALIAMETDLVRPLVRFHLFDSPEQLLTQVLRRLSNESPMILVITN